MTTKRQYGPIDLDLNLDLGRKQSPLAGLRDYLNRALRNRRNRTEVMQLVDFTDSQLLDIGLTRDDLRRALHGGYFDDPSCTLIDAARWRSRKAVAECR